MSAFTQLFVLFVLMMSYSVVSHADNKQLLKGEWLDQACHVAGSDVVLSAQTRFKFEGNQVLVVNRYFESNDCSGEPTYSVAYEGTLEIGEINVYGDGKTATEYSIIIPSAVVESAHFESGITLSSVDSCDMKSWSFGDSRDMFTCVFSQERTNVIQAMALVEGNTLFKGLVVAKTRG